MKLTSGAKGGLVLSRMGLSTCVALFVTACGGAPSKSGSAPPSSTTAGDEPVTYFVRVQGHEQLLGTLAPDGTLTRNPKLPTGDADLDGAAASKALSVKLDTSGRPVATSGPVKTDEPRITWALGEDGTITWRVDPPSALASPPIVMRRGFRVLPDGTASLPQLGMAYVLRDDGTVAQRFRDGKEQVEPRWRVQGPLGASKRRAMVGLVILDDFFDTGGGMVP